MAEEAYMPQPQPGSSSQAPEPWKLVGRDSPAGKALFKLYGGDAAGKKVGNEYHQRNKEQKLASGWTPPPSAPEPQFQRPQVNYPKFGVSKTASPPPAAVNYIPRRKPGDQILKEMSDEQRRMRAERPPPPKGPLLDDAAKERCAALMRYRGKIPEPTAEELEEARAARGVRKTKPRTERDELQDLFDAVMQEIEERREFLKELEAAGALKQQHVHQVRAEIQLRCADLDKIDRMLRAMDEDAR